MKLIDTNDFLLGSHGLNRFRESLVSKLVMYILRLHKLDKLNVKVNDDDPEVLLDSLIEALGVTIEVSKEDLEKIPKNGTFITVSNHPFGMVSSWCVCYVNYVRIIKSCLIFC